MSDRTALTRGAALAGGVDEWKETTLGNLADSLYEEMLARIKEDDESVPYRRGPYFYYSRTEKGKQYSILCRKARASAPSLSCRSAGTVLSSPT